MAPLNIHDEESVAPKRKKNKTLKILLGIAALVAVPAIGTTLAASITIGGGTAIQFGQGVQQATACDDALTVTATSSFDNATGAGQFNVGTIVVSGIADACTGKTFTVKAFGDSDDNALTLSASGASSPACRAVPTIGSGAMSIASESNNTCVGTINSTYSANATVITFTPSTLLNASTVFKITVETT